MLAVPEGGTIAAQDISQNGGNYWRQILSRLKGATGADATWVTHYDVAGRRGRILFAVNIAPEIAVSYQDGACRSDPWLQHDYLFQDVGGVVQGGDLISDDALEASSFHEEWLAPQNLFYHLFGVIARNSASLTVISMARARVKKPFDEAAAAILGASLPATAAVWRLEHLMQVARAETQAVWRATDLLNCGVLLANASGRVLGINRRGREIIDARDGIGLNDGYLVAFRYQDQIQLQTVLQQLPMANGGMLPMRALAFPRNGKTAPLHLVLTAIPDPRRSGETDPPLICVVISDRDQLDSVSVALLRDLFGLTRVEAEVAGLLSDGYSLEEVSQRLHASKHTVRTYLKSIFQKTDTHRQAMLVRLILRGVGMIRSPDLEG